MTQEVVRHWVRLGFHARESWANECVCVAGRLAFPGWWDGTLKKNGSYELRPRLGPMGRDPGKAKTPCGRQGKEVRLSGGELREHEQMEGAMA